jgi:hypothetical protein
MGNGGLSFKLGAYSIPGKELILPLLQSLKIPTQSLELQSIFYGGRGEVTGVTGVH